MCKFSSEKAFVNILTFSKKNCNNTILLLKYLSFSDLVSHLHNSWFPSFVLVAVGQFTFVMYALCILYLTTFSYNQISQGRNFIWSHK